jgi:DNA-binding response OmpR family regulator
VGTRRLLIVEDDGSTRRALRSVFGRMGWDVIGAATVVDGLARLEEGPPPDAMIVDLMLPDGRGEDLLQRVRELGLATRLVVLSGVISTTRIEGLADLRPDAVLPKTMSIGEVWEGLIRACEGQPAEGEDAGTDEHRALNPASPRRPATDC